MEFINFVNEMFVRQFGPLGPLLAVGIPGMFLILLTLPVLLRRTRDPLDKLREQAGQGRNTKQQRLRASSKNDRLEKYSNFLEPQSEEAYSAIRLKLMQAGYRNGQSVRTYHFVQFTLGLGLLVLGVIYTLIRSADGEPSVQSMMMTGLLPGLVGYMIPKYWVTKRVEKRQEEITNGFPDALDMMLVCVEAGQSLDQSIIRVAKELQAGHPALAEEFEIVAQEMKAGKDKTAVLKDMSERAGVQDVSSFVTVLVQSTIFGTSIADALRVYASEMRDKRVMRAEEKANKLPTKMTLATMMLTVPPLLLILIGPSIYDMVTKLGSKF